MSTSSGAAPRRISRRRALQTSAALATVPAGIGLGRLGVAQDATPAAPPPDEGGVEVTAANVDAGIAALPDLIEGYLQQTGVPGVAVGVVYQDEARFLDGYGVTEVGGGAQVDADTVFQLASVSKPVASTVVSALVGEGVVTWDTKVADIDPSFALSDPWVTANVTLADLFAHRSGLADHAGDTLEDLGADREMVLHRLRYLEPGGAFRASYAYTNFGLTAAAVAAATAARGVWEDVSAEKLYGPAGMTRTTSRHADFMAMDNRAVGHMEQDGAWVHAYDRQPDAQSPAGGVSSSVRDMSQWLRLQLNYGLLDGEQLVGEAALGLTHLPQIVRTIPADPSTQLAPFYGLGWNVTTPHKATCCSATRGRSPWAPEPRSISSQSTGWASSCSPTPPRSASPKPWRSASSTSAAPAR